MSRQLPGEPGRDQSGGVGLLTLEQLAAMPGLDFLRGLMEGRSPAPPFSKVARVAPISIERGKVVFSGLPSADFYNPMGIVHGGWIALLLDTVMGCAVHSALPAGKAYTTIEMKTSFIRAVRESSGPLTAEGVVLHVGGNVASAEGKIYDDRKRLVAHGSETCMIWNAGEARS